MSHQCLSTNNGSPRNRERENEVEEIIQEIMVDYELNNPHTLNSSIEVSSTSIYDYLGRHNLFFFIF